MAVIEVVDLRKSYGDVHAVRGVSFAVEQGECVAVLERWSGASSVLPVPRSTPLNRSGAL